MTLLQWLKRNEEHAAWDYLGDGELHITVIDRGASLDDLGSLIDAGDIGIDPECPGAALVTIG